MPSPISTLPAPDAQDDHAIDHTGDHTSGHDMSLNGPADANDVFASAPLTVLPIDETEDADENPEIAGDMPLPLFERLGGIDLARYAISSATTLKRGCVLIGDKGTGKSEGVHAGLRWYDASQKQREAADPRYQRSYALHFPNLAKETEHGLAVLLGKQLLPDFSDRAGVRTKSPQALRDEIASHLLKNRYAVIVIDEAEFLTPACLEFLRHLMSTAAPRDSRQYEGSGKRPAGIGVVLVGTPVLKARIVASEEAGHRWAEILDVEPLTLEDACQVYAHWLPTLTAAFGAAIGVNSMAWVNYVGTTLAQGNVLPLRVIDHHVRTYLHEIATMYPGLRGLDQVPVDRDRFEDAFRRATQMFRTEVHAWEQQLANRRRRR